VYYFGFETTPVLLVVMSTPCWMRISAKSMSELRSCIFYKSNSKIYANAVVRSELLNIAESLPA